MKEITCREARKKIAQAINRAAALELSSGHFTARNDGKERATVLQELDDSFAILEWDGAALELTNRLEYRLDEDGPRELILIKAPGEIISLRIEGPL